eukprot:1149173-Pelagomonas_calceolata.AAC.1
MGQSCKIAEGLLMDALTNSLYIMAIDKQGEGFREVDSNNEEVSERQSMTMTRVLKGGPQNINIAGKQYRHQGKCTTEEFGVGRDEGGHYLKRSTD